MKCIESSNTATSPHDRFTIAYAELLDWQRLYKDRLRHRHRQQQPTRLECTLGLGAFHHACDPFVC